MKKLLFVYPNLDLGGSTTALLALLEQLDYTKMQVDLLLLECRESDRSKLPRQVRLLPQAAPFALWNAKIRRKKLCNAVFTGKAFRMLIEVLRAGKKPFVPHLKAAMNQMLAHIHADFCAPLPGGYDTAVAYLELWPTIYVAQKVKAARKVAWVHVDYEAARLNAALDAKDYAKFDKIVCVAPQNAARLKKVFPALAERILFSENCINAGAVREQSRACVPESEYAGYPGFKILTVARLDSYTKGLDRILAAAAQLKDKMEFRWYLVGGGQDETALKKQAAEMQLQGILYFLGAKENPYPYYAGANLFVLASRNEGKPVTVTEAQLLGLPVLVTRYPAAQGQIRDGVDGRIVPNEDGNALADEIFSLAQKPERLAAFREALNERKTPAAAGARLEEILWPEKERP